MKKIFTIALLLFSIATFAQGNLQFNQVLTYSGTIDCGQASPTWTVPAGKVWKIEYRSIVTGNPNFEVSTNSYTPAGPLFNLNGTKLSDVHPVRNGNPAWYNTVSTDLNHPMWLKSGDQISFSLDGSVVCFEYPKYNYAISILEYNIIP